MKRILPGLGLSALLLCMVLWRPLFVADDFVYDAALRNIKSVAGDSVVIVAIDDESISNYGAWPWSRAMIARLVDSLNVASPRVIALDMFLPLKSDLPDDNLILADALKKAAKAVLPFRVGQIVKQSPGSLGALPQDVSAAKFSIVRNKEQLANVDVYSAIEVQSVDTSFSAIAQNSGFLNVSTSKHSKVVREIIHVVKAGDNYLPSFGIASVSAYLGLNSNQRILDSEPAVLLGSKKVPMSNYGCTMFLNYCSPPSTIRRISASALLSGGYEKSLLRDKLVFVGVTTPMVEADFFATPRTDNMPGVEVWATSALDIIENRWINNNRIPLWIANLLLTLLIFPGLAFLAVRQKKWIALASGGAGVVLSIILAIVLMQNSLYFWNPLNAVYGFVALVVWCFYTREKK